MEAEGCRTHLNMINLVLQEAQLALPVFWFCMFEVKRLSLDIRTRADEFRSVWLPGAVTQWEEFSGWCEARVESGEAKNSLNTAYIIRASYSLRKLSSLVWKFSWMLLSRVPNCWWCWTEICCSITCFGLYSLSQLRTSFSLLTGYFGRD